MTRPVTLITGASSGIGAELARLCARDGDELLIVARRRDRLQALKDELGERVHLAAADLTDPDAPAEIASACEAAGFHVETLINNAGFGLIGRFAELPLDRQIEMVQVNVAALTHLTRLVLPGMIERRSGAIMNVASTAAFQAGPGMAVYFATKAFVLSLTEALHQELKESGIKVSALCPGPVATEFGEVAGASDRKQPIGSADARSVADAGLRALRRNQAIFIPGLSNKFTAQSNRFMPRAAMRRIVAALKF